MLNFSKKIIAVLNYLAHLYLAGEDPEIVLGNFIADHVKGKQLQLFDPQIQTGIIMHRAIDRFTDGHPLVKAGILQLQPTFHKYAGVVLDMYYDHFLSSLWNRYSGMSLDDFTQSRFKILNSYHDRLPERSARLLYFMEKQNWLESYGTYDGLKQAFTGMARRTPFHSGMELAADYLWSEYTVFRDNFISYFPDLQAFVDDYGTANPGIRSQYSAE